MQLRTSNNNFFIPLVLSFFVFLNGCVYLVIGGVGALGGYVISPDTVEGILTNKDRDRVWDSTVEVASVMGIIQDRNESGGVLITKVQGTKVTITIVQTSSSTVKVTVKARKAFLPKIGVAEEVYTKIVTHVNE